MIPDSTLSFRDNERVTLWNWLMQTLDNSIAQQSENVASPELTPDARQHAAGALWALLDVKRGLQVAREEQLNRP